MIETHAPPVRPMVDRLAPVLCALCKHPVAHMDQTVPKTRAGGLCTRCKRGKDGCKREVYTFEVVVESRP